MFGHDVPVWTVGWHDVPPLGHDVSYCWGMMCPCGQNDNWNIAEKWQYSLIFYRICSHYLQGVAECYPVLLDFSLTVKAATLIFISGRCSAISSAKEEKSGYIFNLVRT